MIASARANNIEMVRSLLEKHTNANAIGSNNMTELLHCAAQTGHLSMCQFLVETGHSNVNAACRSGQTALIYASSAGQLSVCRFLVETCHANVNAATNDGKTALIAASLSGHRSVCRLLVETGRANVHAKSCNGRTALHEACIFRKVKIVQYLIQATGADANAFDNSRNTCLHHACLSGSLEITQCLIELGRARAETTNGEGRTALHCACHMGCKLELVQYLVRRELVNVDAVDCSLGQTALHLACWFGRLDAVKCLVEEGQANVHIVAREGQTALHWACSCVVGGDPIYLVQYLIDSCLVDALAVDQFGQTALHLASKRQYYFRVIHYLVIRHPIH